jgi:hypothetical protein
MTMSNVFAVTGSPPSFTLGATKRARAASNSVSIKTSETTRAAAACLLSNSPRVPSTVSAKLCCLLASLSRESPVEVGKRFL